MSDDRQHPEDRPTNDPEATPPAAAPGPDAGGAPRADDDPPIPLAATRATLEEVLRREAVEIGRRRTAFGVGEAVPDGEGAEGLTGLSLSGGGIRSACFNLGILEGLDRRPAAGEGGRNCLECFDYISSVSGGSYAAGHLATAMLDPLPGDEARAEWLGKVQLTSKTVPGWVWGLGVWFLGVVFQMLKTGSLLVAVLAFVAFLIRILDAPDAATFSTAMGLSSDVARGFVPFWLTLWAFLVGYCINSSIRRGGRWAKLWFAYFGAVTVAYACAVWFSYSNDPATICGLSFRVQYGFLAALFAPPTAACAAVALWRSTVTQDSPTYRRCRRAWGRFKVKARRLTAGVRGLASRLHRPARTTAGGGPGRAGTGLAPSGFVDGPTLKTSLLAPILVALFCFAALVTTGDVSLGGGAGDEAGKAKDLLGRSEWYGELGNRIYYFACGALALISVGFLFPHDLFKSARRVEAFDLASGPRGAGRGPRRGWEPVFRVVVFLCSYGFVLLLVFVAFSTVARENVSGYYNWRTDLPWAAFHVADLRESDPAWERIERDARGPRGPWEKLAGRFLEAREVADFPLTVDRERSAEIRLLDSRPWIDRALWPLAWAWSRAPWGGREGYAISPSAEVHYQKLAEQDRDQRKLARAIADHILSDPTLYTIIPEAAVTPDPAERPANWDPKRYEGLGDRYRRRAMSLAALRLPGAPPPIDPSVARSRTTTAVVDGGPGLGAAIRNNNRRALHLYLPGLLRDRRDGLVFASIVWREDQWTRLRICLVAVAAWLLCCVVNVNTYALQKFYRGHVIDSWVKIDPGKASPRWLHQTRSHYRGWEFGPRLTGDRRGRSAPAPRRAPLLLINATLEGNRSLGDEPELPSHIFTFSPVASGAGAAQYWTAEESGGKPIEAFARRNRLDVGNIVAISGAFLSPGTIANPALSAVLHLFNIQTGYWVRMPDEFRVRTVKESLAFHLCQSIGIDRNDDSRLMLTDGAHVENLGLYALLRRRCRLIVVSDCSQEDAGAREERRFDSLVQAMQQAAVDGVEIGPFLSSRAYRYWLHTSEIPSDEPKLPTCRRPRATGLSLVRAVKPPRPAATGWEAALGRILNLMRPQREAAEPAAGEAAPAPPNPSPAGLDQAGAGLVFAQEHYVFARILYPDGGRGLLVYLRPTLTGDEGDALLHGAAHTQFPDDDPVDQFYTPAKMNTYRLLGRHIADELMDDPVMKDVVSAILKGREIARPPGHASACNLVEHCREDCDRHGSICSRDMPRSVRLELLAAMSLRDREDGAPGTNGHAGRETLIT